ncbi:MAG: deoxyguanosinetriphosphate triphosphohydrolase, partial [Oscillospiraceae bacterium]
GKERAVCDYIAGMTDKFAVDKYGEAFIPQAWTVK